MSGRRDRDLLVLWDVDGTLLNAGGVGTDLYFVVFGQLFGRSPEVLAPMAGRTDRAIILETLTLAGVPEPRRHVDPFIAGLAAHAPSVRELVAARGRALPGAAAALAALGAGDGRVRQSVLTGNIRAVAEVKLAGVGLRDSLDLCIGAYGDDHEERVELVHLARRRAAAAHGRPARSAGAAPEFDGAATIVVGDTPLDVAAALAAGARAVAVATGSFSAAELRSAGADVVLPDLVDTRLVVEAVLAGLCHHARQRIGRLRLVRHRAARRRARPEPPGPAALGKRARHLGGRGAAVAGDVVPVVAQRRAAAGRGVVVAAPVVPAAFRGMRQLPVELDDQPVLLVVPVPEAAAAVGLGERHLPAGLGQPVRAFHVPVITELEHRVRSPGPGGDHLVEFAAPAQPLPGAHRHPQRPLPRQPPPERGGYPPAGFVEAIRRAYQVGDRLLDNGPRQHSTRKTRVLVNVRGTMNHYPS
ncbi:MAG TPA: haloacid dehalogenase-like hydrolase [Trebonia sp.]|jgi:phosphoglycolate phosphatase-like HAD superfamily hydrolase